VDVVSAAISPPPYGTSTDDNEEERVMPTESVHNKLGRVRPPRVHIVYEVEVGDSIEQRELPFVVGVMANLTGHAGSDQPALRDRKFVDVTPDSLDAVMASTAPHLDLIVPNTLHGQESGSLKVSLDFTRLEDFSPDQVALQVEPLRQLMQLRQELADLRGSLQGNDRLDSILQATIADADKLAQLRTEVATPEE
jgi:type VI secretion system protein ImpB